MERVAHTDYVFAEHEISVPSETYDASQYLFSGVYFLFDDDELIYIGQSEQVLSRIADHKRNGKIFDRFSVIRCGAEWLLPLEAACIRKFKPPLNRAHTAEEWVGDATVIQAPPTFHPVVAPVVNTFGDRMTVTQVASYSGISKSTLDKLRVYGGGPTYIKIGKRVVYHRTDIDAWMDASRRVTTWQGR